MVAASRLTGYSWTPTSILYRATAYLTSTSRLQLVNMILLGRSGCWGVGPPQVTGTTFRYVQMLTEISGFPKHGSNFACRWTFSHTRSALGKHFLTSKKNQCCCYIATKIVPMNILSQRLFGFPATIKLPKWVQQY